MPTINFTFPRAVVQVSMSSDTPATRLTITPGPYAGSPGVPWSLRTDEHKRLNQMVIDWVSLQGQTALATLLTAERDAPPGVGY